MREALSPGTGASDQGNKPHICRQEGGGHLWYAAPGLETVEVIRLEGKRHVIVENDEGDERTRAEPFEADELPTSVLWSRRASRRR